jgi:cytidylate kinase
VPLSLTIAVSREAGARGSSIARRAGEKLGWQVYTQDVLEYIAQEGSFRQEVVDNLPPAAGPWVQEQLRRLPAAAQGDRQASLVNLAHIILALGAQGEVILIGRGAGFLLPARSTLHVRFVAPLQDRIAYMGQWLRLTREEAAEQVRLRDARRNEFIESRFHCRPTEAYHYDLTLNSSLLGEELCADLVVQAARSKLHALGSEP